jgi:flagellar hook-basal body complex protein FliE
MDISSLSAISGIQNVTQYASNAIKTEDSDKTGTASFDSLLNSAMNLVQQTEDYSNKAEEEEIKYAMGESDSMHDLMIAQQKASVSLQYTVAVKNTAVEAYKSIMNMQI